MWAARLGVRLDSLEVEIEADYDNRGELGVSTEVPPGYTQVRYIVSVASPAPEADVARLLDTADTFSPYRDVYARAHDVRRESALHGVRSLTMDARLQRRIQRYGWDKAAAFYEQYWRRSSRPRSSGCSRWPICDRASACWSIACGTGLVTFPAADAVGPSGSIAATDISETMVERVASEASRRGLAHVTAARMDAEDLRFPDGSFRRRALRARADVRAGPARRVRRDDPRAAAGGPRRRRGVGRARTAAMGRDLPIVDARVQSEVCPMFFQLGTGDLLRQSLAGAGSPISRSSACRPRSRTNRGRDAWARVRGRTGGAGVLAIRRAHARGAQTEYLASIERFRTGEGYAIPGEFVVAMATRDGSPP